MKPTIALIIPLGGMPDQGLPGVELPVDPGYGIGAEHPDTGGPSPGRPSTGPVRPGWPGRPSTGPVRPGRPVDPGYGHPDETPEVSHPIELPPPAVWPPAGVVAPPIYDPGAVWPPAGTVEPPIVYPPTGVWPPKVPPGYVVVWVPGVGAVGIKLGASVGGGPVMPGAPVPTPKV